MQSDPKEKMDDNKLTGMGIPKIVSKTKRKGQLFPRNIRERVSCGKASPKCSKRRSKGREFLDVLNRKKPKILSSGSISAPNKTFTPITRAIKGINI